MADKPQRGRVYLVGAGPGDPKLLTLRGKECLEQADVVFYDYLANPVLLSHAPPQAELTLPVRVVVNSARRSPSGGEVIHVVFLLFKISATIKSSCAYFF